MPKAAWGRIASQDLEHCPQRSRREVLLLKPHAVPVPCIVPHPARVSLERGNATLEELLHYLGRSDTERPQTLEAALDESKLGDHDRLTVPS